MFQIYIQLMFTILYPSPYNIIDLFTTTANSKINIFVWTFTEFSLKIWESKFLLFKMTFENNPFKGSEQLYMVAELRVQCFVIFLFNTLLA